MAIETVDVPVSSIYNTKTTRTPKQELGKDDFLLLLTQQLKNQDPLEPMDNTEYISQMANFSSLEQMLNMNKNIETLVKTNSSSQKLDAMRFLGSTVTVKTSDMEESLTGVVDMVGFTGEKPYLKVGDYSFSIDDVQIVSPTIYDTNTGQPVADNSSPGSASETTA